MQYPKAWNYTLKRNKYRGRAVFIYSGEMNERKPICLDHDNVQYNKSKRGRTNY